MLSKISRPSAHAKDGFAGALRVRHQAGHIPVFVADAGDVQERAVGIGQFSLARPARSRIARGPDRCVRSLSRVSCVRKITAFAVGDRHAQQLPGGIWIGEGRAVRERFQIDMLAPKLEGAVTDQSARAANPPRRGSGTHCRYPRTSPPWRQTRNTACIIGLNRAMAPVRR